MKFSPMLQLTICVRSRSVTLALRSLFNFIRENQSSVLQSRSVTTNKKPPPFTISPTTRMNETKFLLLDGGTATELVRLGHPDIEMHPLWSSVLLQRDPEIICKVHENFLTAGSDIILTVSYQATVAGFMKHANIPEQEAIRLIQLSVKLAQQSRDKHNKTAKIAGSLGPVGVQFADGSEYTGDYVDAMEEKEIQDMHRPQIKALLETGVDYLAFETVPALKEAVAIVNLLEAEFPLAKAWLTFSCKNGLETCHGESFYSAIKSVYQSNNIIAVGVNCTDPNFVTSLLKSIQSLNIQKPIIVKPNSGESWDDATDEWIGKERCIDINTKIEEWMKNGAQWLGGCCRVYPDTIVKFRQTLARLQQKGKSEGD